MCGGGGDGGEPIMKWKGDWKEGREGLRIVADNSGRKALFGFKETQAAILMQATETKQTTERARAHYN